jgi:hypothetical protein
MSETVELRDLICCPCHASHLTTLHLYTIDVFAHPRHPIVFGYRSVPDLLVRRGRVGFGVAYIRGRSHLKVLLLLYFAEPHCHSPERSRKCADRSAVGAVPRLLPVARHQCGEDPRR